MLPGTPHSAAAAGPFRPGVCASGGLAYFFIFVPVDMESEEVGEDLGNWLLLNAWWSSSQFHV